MARLILTRDVIRYASDRFLEIELVTNTVTGSEDPTCHPLLQRNFILIPSDYATTNEDSQETGFMVLEQR